MSDGVLWIGTIGNGLVRLARGQWKHYTTQNGLAGNSIDYLIGDGRRVPLDRVQCRFDARQEKRTGRF